MAAIIPQYVVLAAGSHMNNSHAAANAGDGASARSEALAAKAIEPWAASPYLQLALVAEAEQQYAEAAHWADEAISRSRHDWNLWASRGRLRDGERERSQPPGATSPRRAASTRIRTVLAEPKPGADE